MDMKKGAGKGFTLIEAIAILLVGAILAVFVVQFVSTSATKTVVPVLSFQDEMAVQETMEEIFGDYKRMIKENKLDIVLLKSNVESSYGSYVDSGKTGYVTFSDNDGDKTFTPSSIQSSVTEDSVLFVTLVKDGHRIYSFFTD